MSELVAQNNGHQDYWFGPTGPQWTPTDLLKQISVEAERLDTRIQTHALESHYENLESPRTRGEDVLPYLDRIGFLTERLSLAHAVWTTKKDIKLLQTRGVQVSHNPGSNLRLRSGIAPAAEMFTAGIPVGIGMDGTSLAGDEDMFAEIRLALALNRPPHVSGPALTARHALQMATEHGAGLMGREHELGCLRPGFYADALVLDLERLTQPWISPEVCPVALIVGRAKASDLRHVVVNGELRLQDRRATGLNEKALMAQICVELTQTPPTDDARQLQQDLRGYLMRWYASWDAVAGLSHPPVSRYGARPFLT